MKEMTETIEEEDILPLPQKDTVKEDIQHHLRLAAVPQIDENIFLFIFKF